MKQVSLREYAKMHKLSYFNVMKMVKSGDVKSITKIENEKEVQYVLVDEAQEKKISANIIETSAKSLTLQEENKLLKKEIVRLKEELEKCNKRTVLA